MMITARLVPSAIMTCSASRSRSSSSGVTSRRIAIASAPGMRERERGADAAAVEALDGELRVAVLPQILEAQRACVASKDFRAVQPPEGFRRGVAMADAEIVIENHDGIVRPLERDRQQIGSLDRRAVLGGHRGVIREEG